MFFLLTEIAPLLRGASDSGVVSDWRALLLGLLDIVKGARGMAKQCGEILAQEEETTGGQVTPERVHELGEAQKAVILATGQIVTHISGLISVTKALKYNRFGDNEPARANAVDVCKAKAQAATGALTSLLAAIKVVL